MGMKKRLLIGGVAAVGVAALIAVPSLFKEDVVEEPLDRGGITFKLDGVEVPATVDNTSPPAEVAEAPAVVATPEPTPPVEAPVEKTHEQLWAEMFGLIQAVPFTNERLAGSLTVITSAALKHRETRPELFTPENIQSTAEKCVAHFDAITDPAALRTELARLRCIL